MKVCGSETGCLKINKKSLVAVSNIIVAVGFSIVTFGFSDIIQKQGNAAMAWGNIEVREKERSYFISSPVKPNGSNKEAFGMIYTLPLKPLRINLIEWLTLVSYSLKLCLHKPQGDAG